MSFQWFAISKFPSTSDKKLGEMKKKRHPGRPGLGCPKIMPLQKIRGIQEINHSYRKNGGTRGMGPLLMINLKDTTIFPMNHHFGRPVFKNPEGKIQPPLLLLTVTYTTAVLWQMEPYSHDPTRGADVFSLSSKPLVKTCLCENRINKKEKIKTYWTTADVVDDFLFYLNTVCPSQMQWHVYLKRIKCGSCCGWLISPTQAGSLAWIIWVCNPGPKMRSICLPKKQTWCIFSDPM